MLLVSHDRRSELEFGGFQWALAGRVPFVMFPFYLRHPIVGEIFLREEDGRWVFDWDCASVATHGRSLAGLISTSYSTPDSQNTEKLRTPGDNRLGKASSTDKPFERDCKEQ